MVRVPTIHPPGGGAAQTRANCTAVSEKVSLAGAQFHSNLRQVAAMESRAGAVLEYR